MFLNSFETINYLNPLTFYNRHLWSSLNYITKPGKSIVLVNNFNAIPTELTLRNPQVASMGSPLAGGCRVTIWKTRPWTIVGNMCGECFNPCT